jgi:hypothetical protein
MQQEIRRQAILLNELCHDQHIPPHEQYTAYYSSTEKVPNKSNHTTQLKRKEKSKDQTLLSPSDELTLCDLHNHT